MRVVCIVIIVFCSISFFAFPLRYKDDIKRAAGEFCVDPVLVAAVIRAESNFDARATSAKGARGLMQLLPSTAEFVAGLVSMDAYELENSRDNIRLGTAYLRYLFDKFGDTRTVLIAYNAGEGNVVRWLGDGDVLTGSPFPETNAYVERVLNAMNYYRLRF